MSADSSLDSYPRDQDNSMRRGTYGDDSYDDGSRQRPPTLDYSRADADESLLLELAAYEADSTMYESPPRDDDNRTL